MPLRGRLRRPTHSASAMPRRSDWHGRRFQRRIPSRPGPAWYSGGEVTASSRSSLICWGRLDQRDPARPATAAACPVIEAYTGAIADHAGAEAVEPLVPVDLGQSAVTRRYLPAVLPGARVLGLKEPAADS